MIEINIIEPLLKLLKSRLPEVIQKFSENGKLMIDKMQNGIQQGDAQSLKEASHNLKGSSASLGATVLAEACYQLEKQASLGDLDNANESIIHIKKIFELSVEQLMNYWNNSIKSENNICDSLNNTIV